MANMRNNNDRYLMAQLNGLIYWLGSRYVLNYSYNGSNSSNSSNDRYSHYL